ncbi:MAG TPA: hypothetical protein VJK02_20255, partial [Anaerolineales bacterium]|nr:hypothetical protein [Anaerolineales bacterium]
MTSSPLIPGSLTPPAAVRTSDSAPGLLVEEVSNPPAFADLFDLVARKPGGSFLDPDPYAVNRWHPACFGYDPFLTFSSKGDGITVSLQGQSRSLTGDPFSYLHGLFQQYADGASVEGHPGSGAIGYFGYDLRHHLEKLPSVAMDDLQLPDCVLNFYDLLFRFDPASNRLCITSSGLPFPPGADRRRRARERLQDGLDLIRRARLAGHTTPPESPHNEAPLESNMS